MKMKAIVIGATGATGKELVKQLLAKDDISEVITLVRRKTVDEHPKLKQHIIDFKAMDDYKDLIRADVAFSCLGTTLKLAGSKEAQWEVDHDYQLKFAENCFENKIPSFVLLSAIGVNPKSKFFYSRMRGELEEAVSQLKFDRLIIFQPSLLIRPNTDRFGERLSGLFLKTINSIGIATNYKPIKTSELSKSMILSLDFYKSGIHKVKVKQIFELIKA